ncbi:hypothetical protein BOTBODRAFT_41005 [Botryobasidium botryosum FD-172 SS1]|uniref:Kinesin-like protein n=1 Tax=Botryobasidium botryosum (strain FD-172 SS1) TaxID=930990 RepID=A0A067MZ30_BOTB1|nr:hypothetical protein BOTBODRAFT_41005 [Botryobasidium botryosum FD-172 SS1]
MFPASKKTPALNDPRTRSKTLSSATPAKSGRSTPVSLSRNSSPPKSPPKNRAAHLYPAPTPPPVLSIADAEEGLVDYKNVEDLSAEIDEQDLLDLDGTGGAGGEDKVLVSIRMKPTSDDTPATWIRDGSGLKLDEAFAKTGSKPPEFLFDKVLTGSENKSIYDATARSHVRAAMDGFNAVIFAYGQTASGKTFTLSGDDANPGIIPCSMKEVFKHIRRTPKREFLLRASYLEIYNEQIHDLLSPPSSVSGSGLGIQDGVGVVGLREEVVTSLKGIKEVLERGEANRRTASTDWNERSSRSHSVFRLVIESREVGASDQKCPSTPNALATPGGTRLQTRGGRSVQASVLSLIDLAGSEKATSDKERTKEGKYINMSLLTLGSVISTLAENASKGKSDHVPFRNSKLTRMLQPSLSGNARISVICTINPTPSAIPESTSTLQFASRVKKVHLSATRKEVIDKDALLDRYRKEIEELKAQLAEREREAPVRNRRLSAKQQIDENKAVHDINGRIQQLTKLILTSHTVTQNKWDESRPGSPSKLDFDRSPYELQEELHRAKSELERQNLRIISLETALEQRPAIPLDAPEYEKDAKILELQKMLRELEMVNTRYEENLGSPLRAVKEDVEKEWKGRVEALEEEARERDEYVRECEKGLEKEKQAKNKLIEQNQALIAFVEQIDSHISQRKSTVTNTLRPTNSFLSSFKPTLSPLAEKIINSPYRSNLDSPSPMKLQLRPQPSLLDQTPEDGLEDPDASFGPMYGNRSVLSLEEDKENIN